MQSTSIPELAQRVDAEMLDIVSSRKMAFYEMMRHHMGWTEELSLPSGARCRGVLCLLSCLACGGAVESATPAAAAVELVHGFTEIHDDVQAGNPTHGVRDAVWWVWGPAQAINAGDGMHALARLALFRLLDSGVSPETTFAGLRVLDQAALALCEGRYVDLDAQERIDIGVEKYLAMAVKKTGALFSGAIELGGLLAGADPNTMDQLAAYGGKVGVAYQVRADLQELSLTDANPSHEVLNKKKLLPVVYALEKAAISDKRRIGDIYFKRVLEPQDVSALRVILADLGAIEYCESFVEREREESARLIEGAGVSSAGVAAIQGYVDELLGP